MDLVEKLIIRFDKLLLLLLKCFIYMFSTVDSPTKGGGADVRCIYSVLSMMCDILRI